MAHFFYTLQCQNEITSCGFDSARHYEALVWNLSLTFAKFSSSGCETQRDDSCGVSLSPVPSRFWGLMRRPCWDPFGLNMDRMKHSNPSLRPSAAPTLKLLSLDLLIGRYSRYPTKNLRSACCSMCLVCLACIHKALLSIANVLREGPSESSSLGRKEGHGMV